MQGKHANVFPLGDGNVWECKVFLKLPSEFLLLKIRSLTMSYKLCKIKFCPNWTFFRPWKKSWMIKYFSEVTLRKKWSIMGIMVKKNVIKLPKIFLTTISRIWGSNHVQIMKYLFRWKYLNKAPFHTCH
jgi:hypothetical protein